MEKSVTKKFRCTVKQAQEIKKQAEYLGFTEAEYIRRRICGSLPSYPQEVKNSLDELRISCVKIGTNINQITHLCNAKGEANNRNLLQLLAQMQQLNKNFEQIRQSVEGMRRQG